MNKQTMLGAISVLLLMSANLYAFDWDNVYFNGFASQGYLKSSDNDLYDAGTDEGTWQFNEFALSTKVLFSDNLNGGLQVMSRDFGSAGNNDINLDWAFLDYGFSDAIGFRVGKFKKPEGLYNTVRDVDAVRSSILLPQGIYSERGRDTHIAVLGISAYGYLDAGDLGSFNYNVYAGTLPVSADDPDIETGLLSGLYGISEDGEVDCKYTFGGQVFWNTPIEGFRVGQSLSTYQLEINGTNTNYGWYSSDIVDAEVDVSIRSVSSFEYQIGDFMINAEYMYNEEKIHDSPLGGDFSSEGPPSGGDSTTKNYCYYVQGVYDITDSIQLGTYYMHNYAERNGDTDPDDSSEYLRDWAISAKYNVTDWWTVKAEYHMYDGYMGAEPERGVEGTNYWDMVAFKTSFSF